MSAKLRVVEGRDGGEDRHEPLSPEEKLRVFKRLTASMMDDALGAWSRVYGEFEGRVAHGPMVTPEAAAGFTPACGWSEFLERMWLLQHYLDHMKRICEGRV